MLLGQSTFFEGLLTARSLLQGCRYARQRIPSEETLLLPTVEHIDDIGDVAEMESDDEQLTVAVVVAKGL